MVTEAENLAQKSYNSYKAGLGRLREDKRLVLNREIGVQLCSPVISTVEVRPETFNVAFKRVEPYINEPRELLPMARKAITELNADRDHLTDTEMEILSAGMCAESVWYLRELKEDPTFRHNEYGEVTLSMLPNPWFVGNPPHPEPVRRWNRGKMDYIQPHGQTLELRIEELLQQVNQVQILDAGVGSATCDVNLKQRFGDLIHTVGLGLDHQKNPVDENVCGPMEVLPAEWTDRFDVVMSNYALCYALLPERAVSELLRVLAPGREAYLDIGDSGRMYATPYRITNELLTPNSRYRYDDAISYYRNFESEQNVRDLIEGWSDKSTRYKVESATPRDSYGYCLQITKEDL